MKKVLFVIATLALCMSANAKYWFSGSVGFGSQSAYNSDNKEKIQYICPEFGMAIEDALEVGVGLNILNPTSFAGQQKFSFGFAPFIRYTFLNDTDNNKNRGISDISVNFTETGKQTISIKWKNADGQTFEASVDVNVSELPPEEEE